MDIKIEDKIKRIKDTFDLIKERDSRNMPFIHLIRLFNMIEKHLRGVIGDERALYMLSITEKIEKMVGTLLKKIEKMVGTLLKKIEVNEIENANYI